MSASYFSIVHIIILVSIAIVYFLLAFLAWRLQRRFFGAILAANLLVFATIGTLLMFVADKYTKLSRLENVTSSRILRNETIVFKGTARNIGNFTLSKCSFVVRLNNNPMSAGGLTGDNIFKPSGLSLFGWLGGGDSADDKPNVIEYSAVVVRDLQPKKSIDFSVAMPYPPYFKNTTYVTKLNCY